MIATNYRRFADALIRQLELDFSGTVGACEKQRAAWWAWLMHAGTPQAAPAAARPAWWVALRRAASQIAKAVKAAVMSLELAFLDEPKAEAPKVPAEIDDHWLDQWFPGKDHVSCRTTFNPFWLQVQCRWVHFGEQDRAWGAERAQGYRDRR